MKRRVAAIVFALALVSSGAAGAAPAASPSPSSAAATCPDGSGGIDFALEDGLAHDIDDARTLRFLKRLVAYDEKQRRAVLARIGTLDPLRLAPPTQAELGCATELSYRTVRAITLLEATWHVDPSERIFEPLTKRLERALGALESDDALAPLGLAQSDLAEPASLTCDVPQRDARTVAAHQPSYPEIARITRAMGRVRARVALTREGLVRSVRLLSSTAGETPGGRAIVREALLAAALSTYEPEFVACSPLAGNYMFTASFSGK